MPPRVRRQGPRNLCECLCILDSNVDEAFAIAQQTGDMDSLERLSRDGFVLTSCYSGTGAAEMAAHQVMRRVNERMRTSGRVVCHAACDASAAAQECLLGHAHIPTDFYNPDDGGRDVANPTHVFKDVFDRLPPHTREEVLLVEKRVLNENATLIEDCARGKVPDAKLKEEQGRLARVLVADLKVILAAAEFEESAFCIRHGTMCPINPRAAQGMEQSLWVECAGTTCCPFSAMGAGGHWLDKATAACLTWAFSVRYYLPDIVLHECVPRFTEGTLNEILGSMPADGHSVYARDTSEDTELSYAMESLVFSPKDLGVPSSRARKYSAFFLSPWVRPPALSVPTTFFRELLVVALAQCCATVSVVLSEAQSKISTH